MEASEFIIIFNTCPSQKVATEIASKLLEQQLAACVNILPTIKSIYVWQGKIENDDELLLMIKTRRDRFDAISKLIKKEHPYELPEVVAVSMSCGLPSYLSWINQTIEQQ